MRASFIVPLKGGKQSQLKAVWIMSGDWVTIYKEEYSARLKENQTLENFYQFGISFTHYQNLHLAPKILQPKLQLCRSFWVPYYYLLGFETVSRSISDFLIAAGSKVVESLPLSSDNLPLTSYLPIVGFQVSYCNSNLPVICSMSPKFQLPFSLLLYFLFLSWC